MIGIAITSTSTSTSMVMKKIMITSMLVMVVTTSTGAHHQDMVTMIIITGDMVGADITRCLPRCSWRQLFPE